MTKSPIIILLQSAMDQNLFRNPEGISQQLKQINQAFENILQTEQFNSFGTLIADLYSKYRTPFLLLLIYSKILDKLADKVKGATMYQTESAIQIMKRASQQDLYVIESLCHKYYALAKDLCIKFQKKDPNIEFGMTSSPELKQDSEFQKIILNFCQIKAQGSNSKDTEIKQNLIKKIMKYEYRSLINNEKNSFQDSAIIWVKENLNELFVNKYLCCRASFSNNNIKNESPQVCSFFEKNQQKKQSNNQYSEIEKTIVSLMNAKGGVILVGFKGEKDNIFSVKGIELKDESEKKKEIEKIKQCVSLIYPKHKHFEAKIQVVKDETGYIYHLNYYISVQFLPIYEIQDVKPKTQNGSTGKPEVCFYKYIDKKTKYIMRIIVKGGHPRHSYHIFKLQKITGTQYSNIVTFYTRNTTENVETGLGEQTLKDLYVKLKAYEKERESNLIPKREKIHPQCRHQMGMNESIFNIDEDSEE